MNTRNFLLALSMSLLIVPTDTSFAQRGAARALEIVEFDLDNGLHVIMHAKRDLPIVTVNVWYHVGSKNEREGRTGFAHLFEHMMFQGSANVPENAHFKFVQQAGGTLNGSTTYDRTNYFETVPSNQLELALWLEADRMRSLAITQRNLDNQRDVVKEERRTRTDNVPYGRMNETLFANAFTVQSYRWPVIGSMADLSAASLDDVVQFHSMYYVPNNASLCIAGDIDYDQTKALVAKHFSDISRGAKEIYRPTAVEPPHSAAIRAAMTDNVQLPAITIAFHIPEQTHPDAYALDLLANILSSGRSSRLYRRLVYTDRLAQTVFASASSMEQPGLFLFRATAQIGKRLEDVEAAIWEEIQKVQNELVTEREYEKSLNRSETSFVNSLASTQSRADALNSFHTFFKGAREINAEVQRIRSVTRDDVRRVAQKYFTAETSTTLYCTPAPKEKKKD